MADKLTHESEIPVTRGGGASMTDTQGGDVRLRVGSLFSGIGGFDLGLERAGHRVVWQVEFDERARSVLRRHWPDAAIYEDVRDVGGIRSGPERQAEGNRPDDGGLRSSANDEPSSCRSGDTRHDPSRPATILAPVDLICGGFPCQDLSVAGRRAGLAGDRSGLWHEFHRIVSELAPTWVLVENVPGLLSSNGGRDLSTIIGGLADLGYMGAYRVVDAQYFGLAQRRKRVFVLASRDSGARRAAQVLALAEGVSGHPAPSREAGSGIAPTLESGANRTGGTRPPGTTVDTAESLVVANALGASGGGPDDNAAQDNHVVAHTLRAEGHDASEDGTGRGVPIVLSSGQANAEIGENLSPTLNLKGDGAPIAFNATQHPISGAISGAISAEGAAVAVFRKAQKAHDPDDCERWEEAERSNTLTGHGTTSSEVVAQSLAIRGREGTPQAELGDDGKANALLTPNGGRAGVGAGAVLATVPRRLTPRECERLQGFPCDWTRWDHEGKELAD